MLALRFRLRARSDFNKAYQTGKTRQGALVLVRARPNNKPFSRFGIVVSKKISKSAVTRNRVKRRISEIVRTNLNRNNGFDIVIIAKTGIAESSPEALKQDIISTISHLTRQP